MIPSPDRVGDFFAFMRERESIRLRKKAGSPWPWTDDPILQTFKFTNVKREHDRTTQELIKRLYRPNYGKATAEECLLNAATSRYFGRWEMAEALGWMPVLDRDYIIHTAQDRQAKGLPVFTGAYVITNGGIKAPKEEVVVNHYLSALWEARKTLINRAASGEWRELIAAMRRIPGFGGTGFMAKETALDLPFTPFWTLVAGDWAPTDLDEWSPVGPGARRGANSVMGGSPQDGLNERDAMSVMNYLFSVREEHWPGSHVVLDLHDIQFQLCEFAKYEKARLGLGRPRNKYRRPA